MTNLIATIAFTLTTNWTTTSIITPVVPESERNYAIYHSTGYNQTGTVLSNTIAVIEWKGQKVPVTLESVQINTIQRVEWK